MLVKANLLVAATPTLCVVSIGSSSCGLTEIPLLEMVRSNIFDSGAVQEALAKLQGQPLEV